MTSKPVRILFVCTGNTCRSPTAEWVARGMLDESPLSERVEVSSAGLAASPGAPLSEYARQLLEDRLGRDVEHSARRLTGEMLKEADWIFTMTHEQCEAVQALVDDPEACILVLQECSGQGGDIPDPYGGQLEDYQEMVETMVEAVEALVAKIRTREHENEDCPGQ